jgi:hypothetical protein
MKVKRAFEVKGIGGLSGDDFSGSIPVSWSESGSLALARAASGAPRRKVFHRRRYCVECVASAEVGRSENLFRGADSLSAHHVRYAGLIVSPNDRG